MWSHYQGQGETWCSEMDKAGWRVRMVERGLPNLPKYSPATCLLSKFKERDTPGEFWEDHCSFGKAYRARELQSPPRIHT